MTPVSASTVTVVRTGEKDKNCLSSFFVTPASEVTGSIRRGEQDLLTIAYKEINPMFTTPTSGKCLSLSKMGKFSWMIRLPPTWPPPPPVAGEMHSLPSPLPPPPPTHLKINTCPENCIPERGGGGGGGGCICVISTWAGTKWLFNLKGQSRADLDVVTINLGNCGWVGCFWYRQTERQALRPAGRQSDRQWQKDRQIERQAYRQTERKTDRGRRSGEQEESLNDIKTYRQTGKQTGRETGRKRTDRHSAEFTDRQHTRIKAGLQTDRKNRQIDSHANRHTDRLQTVRETAWFFMSVLFFRKMWNESISLIVVLCIVFLYSQAGWQHRNILYSSLVLAEFAELKS